MKGIFQFYQPQEDREPVLVSPDREILREGLIEAASVRDVEELGALQFDPEVLAAAVELPHHSQLKPEYNGMYVRYDGNCKDQHWGTESTVRMAVNLAYNWWKQGFTPTMLLGDISARNFAQTGCHSAHRTGTHLDADLGGSLPKDPGYNLDKKEKCAVICWFAIQLGVRRVLFSDSEVAGAVNKIAAQKGLPGRVQVRADHDNHFHLEMPLS